MSNLLDKASVILTPTAYNNGEALCVKPSDGSGDFDFSRNSAATRVNAQGLVENVQILSSNLVQNGDFSEEGAEEVSNGSFSQEGVQQISNGSFDTDTKWTTNTGWSISGGSANCDGTQSGNTTLVQQNGIKGAIIDFVVGKTYKVNFDVVVTSGVITQLEVASGIDGNDITTSGNHTTYITAVSTNDRFTITANPDFVGSIDNVSVREVGQDWSLGTGWSIGEDKAVATNAPSGQSVSQNAVASQIPNGTTVKVSFEVTSISQGSFGIYFSGSLVGSLNSVGVGTFYFVKGTETSFYIRALGTTSGSVTNISVKEVGQNWTVTNSDANNYVEFGDGTARLKFLNTSPITTLQSTAQYVSGKKYKLIVDVKEVVSGGIKIEQAGISQTYNSVGIQEAIIEPTGTSFINFYRATSNVDITLNSVSLIEITDDTNLPRINYEGFSYQDAFGSELVVNGDFEDGSTGWVLSAQTSVVNGQLVIDALDGSFQFAEQNVTTTVDKNYKLQFEITEINSGGEIQFLYDNTLIGLTYASVGTHEIYFTSTVTNGTLQIKRKFPSNTEAVIDNVSVKEYLGQSVIPNSGCGSWLWEPQSTNLITQSELFSDSVWNKSRSTYTSDAIKSPSGLINMGYLTEDTTANNTHYMRTFLTLTDGVDYTLSVFAKAKERNIICLGDNAAAQSNTGVWFDLTNGVVLSQRSGYVGSIKDFGNGIYKCSVVYSASASRQYADIALSLSDGVNIYTGDGTSGVYIWGAQLEQQSYATSYIPTSGSTVTRNQDVCTNGGSLATINSTEGVLYAEIAALANDGTNREISINNGTTNDRIQILLAPASNELLIFYKAQSGATQFIMSETLADATQFNKIAFKWKANDFALWVNGTERATISSGVTSNVGVLTKIDFDQFNGGTKFYGKTKALAVWKEALSDSELQSLTTI